MTEQPGGELINESEHGQALEESSLSSSKSADSSGESDHKDAGILIVYWEEMMRELLIDVFQTEGYHNLYQAENARECLDIVRNHPGQVQLVIIEPVMPGGSGNDVIEQLLVREKRDIAIIITPSHCTREMLDWYAGFAVHGCFDCLYRPFNTEDITTAVEGLLAARADGPGITQESFEPQDQFASPERSGSLKPRWSLDDHEEQCAVCGDVCGLADTSDLFEADRSQSNHNQLVPLAGGLKCELERLKIELDNLTANVSRALVSEQEASASRYRLDRVRSSIFSLREAMDAVLAQLDDEK